MYREKLPKGGGGLGQFEGLRRSLAKKKEWCFWRGLDIPIHTVCICVYVIYIIWVYKSVYYWHFKDVCIGASISFEIIEVFPDTGCKNNKLCPVNHETRLYREDYLVETLWTSNTYGLNERKRIADPNFPVGCSLP